MTYQMRAACKDCGGTAGEIRPKSGQNTVYCAGCGRYAGYNAPKTETGEAPRTVTSTHAGIRPKQRVRVIDRDGGRCAHCGRAAPDVILHIGHIISVREGHDAGLTDDEINDDENLVAECEECNLGRGANPPPLRRILTLALRRRRQEAR